MGIFSLFNKKNKSEPDNDYNNLNANELNKKIDPLDSIKIVREDDEFDGNFSIYFTHIGNKEENSYLPMYYDAIDLGHEKVSSFKHLGIGFKIFNNILYMSVYLIGENNFDFKSDSKLHLIFENKEHLIFEFDSDYSGEDIMKYNLIQIEPEKLKYFTDHYLDKWKFTDSQGYYIVGDNTLFGDATSNIQDKKTAQRALQYISKGIVNEYLKLK
tara:strand:- start:155 stop:796 length:642 start_codon:yes stop_codon:yes gene_type:complete